MVVVGGVVKRAGMKVYSLVVDDATLVYYTLDFIVLSLFSHPNKFLFENNPLNFNITEGLLRMKLFLIENINDKNKHNRRKYLFKGLKSKVFR